MTDDEMAAALRAKGWRIQPPLTQDNCPHHNQRGSCGMGTAGYISEWWCMDCGKHSRIEGPPPSPAPTCAQTMFQNSPL